MDTILATAHPGIYSPDHPVRLAERIWWVGHYLPGDPFQCHVYLIDNGDNSVLIDPGSKLTFEHVLAKVEEILPFNKIRYFICHHQDPDITGALPMIDQLAASRPDAMIISHWRAIALLKHYGLTLPLLCVEEHHWQLDIGGRLLRFIFTPYLHFPGAFCTFDETTGILFSSDLFGGFTEEWQLVAQDEGYFEAIRPFHEHYMPSREILHHAMVKLEQYPITLIAPQHGSIIPRHLVEFMINRLKDIDCGLYLMTQTSSEIMHLSRLNKMLRNFLETLVLHRDFGEVARALFQQAVDLLPVVDLAFYAQATDGQVFLLAAESRFRGVAAELPDECQGALGLRPDEWQARYRAEVLVHCRPIADGAEACQLFLPLYTIERPSVHALAVFSLSGPVTLDRELTGTLAQMGTPLSIAVEREIIFRSMELERQRFYEQAIRDPLTGLYTRVYMNEAVKRLCDIHDREPEATVYAIMLDIDHFKEVNDQQGHNAGDLVLRQVAKVILRETRSADIQVRMGGEEFAVFVVSSSSEIVTEIAARIRGEVSRLRLAPPLADLSLTISGGIARRRQNEELAKTIQRADRALYEAKNNGRNRVCLAADDEARQDG